jgi:hypothetical protein
MTLDQQYLSFPQLTVYSALYRNGTMLGLTCHVVIPAKSKPASSVIPDPLHHTPLQLSTVHHQWIDRFPFPRMRDNMIILSGIIDAECFLDDLFCLASFTLSPGGMSWDPEVWKIGKEFGEKWGYLFY